MHDRDVRGYVAEFLGTFFVVFLSAAAVCANVRGELRGWMTVAIAITAGASYAAALALTLPFSSGFLNPGTTLALWVFRHLEGLRTTFYVIAQLLGGILAGLAVRLLFGYPESAARINHLGTPHLIVENLGSDPLGMRLVGIGIELLIAFLVALVFFVTVLRPRAMAKSDRLGALYIGLAVTACTLAAFPLTGASLNPARWFGTVVWEMTIPGANALGDHVPYWVGPIAGALLASWLYQAFFQPSSAEMGKSNSSER